jgi:ribosome modulation factor
MRDAEERGRQASVSGRAHEHITLGILMKRYQILERCREYRII